MTREWLGFGAKGQDLNVQLHIHSFILFKLSDCHGKVA